MENLNLFTSIESSSKDSSNTTTNSSKDTKKEGMSLFDSLLKESSVTLSKEEKIVNTTASVSDNANSDNETNTEQNLTNLSKNDLKTQKLDTLITKTNTSSDTTINDESSVTNKEENLNIKISKASINNVSTVSTSSLNKLVVDSKLGTIKEVTNLNSSSPTSVNASEITSIKQVVSSPAVAKLENPETKEINNTQVIADKTVKLSTDISTTAQSQKIPLSNEIVSNTNDNQLDENIDVKINSNSSDKNQLVKEILTTNKETKEALIDSGEISKNEIKSDNGMKVGITLNQLDKPSKVESEISANSSLVLDSQNNLTVSNETKKNITNTEDILVKDNSSETKGLSLMDKLLNDAKQQIGLVNKTETSDNISEKQQTLNISNEKEMNDTKVISSTPSINLEQDNSLDLEIQSKVNLDLNIDNSEVNSLNKQELTNESIQNNNSLTTTLNVTQNSINTDTKIPENEVKEILTKNFDALKTESSLTNKINDINSDETMFHKNSNIDVIDNKISSSISNENTQNTSNLSQNTVLKNDTAISNSKSLDGLSQEAIVKDDTSVKSSLLDDLIKKATAQINKEDKPESKIETQNTLNILNKEQVQKSDVLGNIFLGLQKNSVTNQNIINTSIARSVLNNATGISDVKRASDILNLNAKDIELKVENNELLKNVDIVKLDRKISILDKVMTNIQKIEDTNILSTKLVDATKVDLVAQTSTSTSILSNINEAEDVTINVNQTLANNIQTRIIGARQHMSSMMSDLARTMYENYKPPVTTFKINLNPANLGMISVVMKNERDSSISISMNMSNNSTLEAMIDNQNSLRSALFRAFGNDDSSFNLDFGSNENSSNQNQNDQEFASNISSTSEISSNTASNSEQEDNLTYL